MSQHTPSYHAGRNYFIKMVLNFDEKGMKETSSNRMRNEGGYPDGSFTDEGDRKGGDGRGELSAVVWQELRWGGDFGVIN